jgi:hypothetical protein
MKKPFLLPIAATVALIAACSDTPTGLAPGAPDLELVDAGQRVKTTKVNAHVYGTFSLTVGDGEAKIVGRTGPAIFPGNSKNSGSCVEGLWYNPQGKPTSGSYTKPHPHCVEEVSGEMIQVVLEPISVEWKVVGNPGNEFLIFGSDGGDAIEVKYVGGSNCPPNNKNCTPVPGHTKGEGIIRAYAIDASTINTTPKRVGILTIDLAGFDKPDGNLFETDCTMNEVTINGDTVLIKCLPHEILADYEPLGVGVSTTGVPGSLYWVKATTPFNYSDM